MDACRFQRLHHRNVTMNCFAPHKQRHWPGTSKWNKVEHRLFSHITMNWRGRPLTSHRGSCHNTARHPTTHALRGQPEPGTMHLHTRLKVKWQLTDAPPPP